MPRQITSCSTKCIEVYLLNKGYYRNHIKKEEEAIFIRIIYIFFHYIWVGFLGIQTFSIFQSKLKCQKPRIDTHSSNTFHQFLDSISFPPSPAAAKTTLVRLHFVWFKDLFSNSMSCLLLLLSGLFWCKLNCHGWIAIIISVIMYVLLILTTALCR